MAVARGREGRPGDREKGRLEAERVGDTGMERRRGRGIEKQWLQKLGDRGESLKAPSLAPCNLFGPR